MKKNIRSSYRSNKRSGFSKNNDSYSKFKPRGRGNVTQLYDKYLKLAKEAASSGDRIQSEYFNQFADHYSRLMIEQGMKFPSNEKFIYISNENSPENSLQENEEKQVSDSSSNNDSSRSLKDNEETELDSESNNSIETVPFIAKEVKKNIKPKK